MGSKQSACSPIYYNYGTPLSNCQTCPSAPSVAPFPQPYPMPLPQPMSPPRPMPLPQSHAVPFPQPCPRPNPQSCAQSCASPSCPAPCPCPVTCPPPYPTSVCTVTGPAMVPGPYGSVFDSQKNTLYVPDAVTATAFDGQDGKYDLKVCGTKIKVMKKKNGLPVYPGRPNEYGYPTQSKKDIYTMAGVGPEGSVYDPQNNIIYVPDEGAKTRLDATDGCIDGTYCGAKIKVKKPKNLPKKATPMYVPGLYSGCASPFGVPSGPSSYASSYHPVSGDYLASYPASHQVPHAGYGYTAPTYAKSAPGSVSRNYGYSYGSSGVYSGTYAAQTYVNAGVSNFNTYGSSTPTYNNHTLSIAQQYNSCSAPTYSNPCTSGPSLGHQSYNFAPTYQHETRTGYTTPISAPITSFKPLFSEASTDFYAPTPNLTTYQAPVTNQVVQSSIHYPGVTSQVDQATFAGNQMPSEAVGSVAHSGAPAGGSSVPPPPPPEASYPISQGFSNAIPNTVASQIGSVVQGSMVSGNGDQPRQTPTLDTLTAALGTTPRAPAPVIESSYTLPNQAPLQGTTTSSAAFPTTYGSQYSTVSYSSAAPNLTTPRVPTPIVPCQPSAATPYF